MSRDLIPSIKQFCLGHDVEVTFAAGEISSNLFRGLPRGADATLPMRVWIASTEVLDRIKNPESVL